MNIIRLWEKLNGLPHKTTIADKVSIAADELITEARKLNEKLSRYTVYQNPLTAMFTDLYEQDQEKGIYKGRQWN